jgi:arylformamidase
MAEAHMTDDSTFSRRAALRGVLACSALTGGSDLATAKPPRENQIQLPFTELPAQGPINAVADIYAETALNLSRLAALTTRCVLDVKYGSDPAQRLDIYLPRQEGLSGLPVFVNIHGGGWVYGYKEWLGLNAPSIVTFPAVYVSVGYRLAPAHAHPAQIEDCLKALAWVHDNIAKHGADAQRIYVGGHSAGAHLASLMTLRTDLYPRFGLPAHPIRACFPFNGVYDFRNVEDYGEVEANNPGKPFIPNAQAAADASPIAFTSNNAVPFFVVWAENDDTLIKAQSAAFVEALKAQPGRVEKHMFLHFDHFWTHLDQQRAASPWTLTLRSWMLGDPVSAPLTGFPAT